MSKARSASILIEVKIKVRINAPVARVWKALLTQSSRWWPHQFYTSPHTKRFVIEPRVGGRCFEDAGGHAGLLWFTITMLQPPDRVEFVGHLSPDYGGPATSMVRIDLAPSAEGTILSLRDAVVGRCDGHTADSLKRGWQLLMGEALKKFVESSKPARRSKPAKSKRKTAP